MNHGKIFNDLFIANLLLSVTVKEFWRSVRIWQSYGKKLSGTFFPDTVSINMKRGWGRGLLIQPCQRGTAFFFSQICTYHMVAAGWGWMDLDPRPIPLAQLVINSIIYPSSREMLVTSFLTWENAESPSQAYNCTTTRRLWIVLKLWRHINYHCITVLNVCVLCFMCFFTVGWATSND